MNEKLSNLEFIENNQEILFIKKNRDKDKEIQLTGREEILIALNI